MFKSFRLQLTAWYLLFFFLLLAGFSGFLYVLLSRDLYERLDTSLADSAKTAAELFHHELPEHQGDMDVAAAEALSELRMPHKMVAILLGNRLLAASDELRRPSIVSALRAGGGTFTLQQLGAHGARACVHVDRRDTQPAIRVAAVESLDSINEQLGTLRQVFFLALPIALLLAGLGGYLLARKSLSPIVAMSEQAESITAKNLHRRLEVGDANRELGRLAHSFNDLLERLDRSFESMRKFMADASHELRTPLAVIRGEAEVTLAQDRDPAEYREALGIVQDEARRLSRLVDDLLNLARADAGHRPLHLEEFYLNDVVEDCCRSVQSLARPKNIRLTCACAGDVGFRGDQELLRRLIVNLLDNAVRFTPVDGEVSVRLDVEGAKARIMVSDTGAGIPPELADQVFQRFFRVDKARSRVEGGFGLGLSIVKWIAESHHGTVTLNSTPGKGSKFTVHLPLEAPATAPVPFIVHSSES